MSWFAESDIIIRTVTVYLFLVAGILLLGKKEISQLSVTDLVFILLISNSVQNAMVGSDSSLTGGLISAGVLLACNYLFKWLSYRYGFFRKVLQGHPVMLVYEGRIIEANMAKLKITREELDAAIHEHGAQAIEDVSLAVMEIDGNISVLTYESAHKTIKKRKVPSKLN